MPATIESIDSDSEALQFIAVAQTGHVSDNALINMVTDLSMYDSQAKPIRIGNLTDEMKEDEEEEIITKKQKQE